jgi:peptidoglycan/xylan/chitin deacetylase (PgdA/CDA1 family)
MYHSVGEIDDDPPLLTVTPERLDAQLAALRVQGLTGMSMRDLHAAGGRGVGLTFDDGYADFLSAAVPVLRARGATATVFCLAGRLGGHNDWDHDGRRKRLMTADELRAAEAEGMEVASHGMRHRRLTELDDAELATETTASRTVLADVLGHEVTGFAYPYGLLDSRVAAAVARAGYRYGCAVTLAGTGVSPGPHAIPRSYVGQRDTGPRLFAKRLRHVGRAVLPR